MRPGIPLVALTISLTGCLSALTGDGVPPPSGAEGVAETPWELRALQDRHTYVVGETIEISAVLEYFGSKPTAQFNISIDGLGYQDHVWEGVVRSGEHVSSKFSFTADQVGCSQIFLEGAIYETRAPICIVEAPSALLDAFDFWTPFPAWYQRDGVAVGELLTTELLLRAADPEWSIVLDVQHSEGLEITQTHGGEASDTSVNQTGYSRFNLEGYSGEVKGPTIEFRALAAGPQQIRLVVQQGELEVVLRHELLVR